MANFWFDKLGHIVPNQLTGIDPETVVAEDEREQVRGRALVVKRLKPLPIEAVVRGYVIGSGWKDYQETGAICGIALPAGLQDGRQAAAARSSPRPARPTWATTTRTSPTNRPRRRTDATLGRRPARAPARPAPSWCAEARDAAIRLYSEAADYAATRGIIIADTKFEFGIDAAGTLHLIDEALTPDSSRFWPADQLRRRQQPAVLRQAIRPRLPGNPGLGQGRPRPQAARRRHRPHQRQVHRGLRKADRQDAVSAACPAIDARPARALSFEATG